MLPISKLDSLLGDTSQLLFIVSTLRSSYIPVKARSKLYGLQIHPYSQGCIYHPCLKHDRSIMTTRNQYWIPNLEINKKVIAQEIQYHLGPGSTVRPYTREVCWSCIPFAYMLMPRQGEEGFLITTPGECLTDVRQ